MASLGTHLTSFLFIVPFGIRRLISSFSIYNNNPSLYTSKTWFFSNPTWKNVDFFVFLIALPISSLTHFSFFFAFSGHPTYKFSFLQQSLVVFIFWVLLIFIGIKEFYDPIAEHGEHFLFVFAGVAFLIEYFMNGKGVVGLGELEYGLLGGLTLLCAAACFFLSFRPSAFFADFLLSCGLVLKGTWVLQVGLSLYTDTFSFKGCGKVVIGGNQSSSDVKCDLDEDKLRGIALMNLLFVGHSIVVLITCFVILGIVSRKNVRSGDLPVIAQNESDRMLMRPLPVYDLE